MDPPATQQLAFIFLAIRLRNSGKSMVPLPSASTSLTMSCSSASVGFCPSERITTPSSLVVIVPYTQNNTLFETSYNVLAAIWRKKDGRGRLLDTKPTPAFQFASVVVEG